MTRRAICFDLDGTLVYSLPDIIGGFQSAIAEQGLPVPAADSPCSTCLPRSPPRAMVRR